MNRKKNRPNKLMGNFYSSFQALVHRRPKDKKIVGVTEPTTSIVQLRQMVIEQIRRLLREDAYLPGINQEEYEKRLERKKQLRLALRQSVYGQRNAKLYLKDFIKEIIISGYGLTENDLDRLLPVTEKNRLSPIEKLLVLLLIYQEKYGRKGFGRLIEDCFLLGKNVPEQPRVSYEEPRAAYEQRRVVYEEPREIYEHQRVIYEHQIDRLYEKKYRRLLYHEKMELVVQLIYQSYKGFGVIDILREFEIDGISSGVSGSLMEREDTEMSMMEQHTQTQCRKVWVIHHGKNICLDFLEIGDRSELIRICRNIYRYHSPGQLSENKGYIVNEMEDGARIAVCRPPFSEEWAFFIRKFDTMEKKELSELLTDAGAEDAILLLKWLVKGCQVVGITGEQGAGKTTLLMAMTGLIPMEFNLRVQEMSFELHLRNLYPERNILSFRETETVSGQAGLDFQKKTDGTVHILGEVATQEVSAWLVQMAQTASRFTLFTHHAKTTNTLVAALRNALLQKGGFSNERIAQQQVVETIRFDVHMAKNSEGHRYIERISEIVSKGELGEYQVKNILLWKDGRYEKGDELSNRVVSEIGQNLEPMEQLCFIEAIKNWRKDATVSSL